MGCLKLTYQEKENGNFFQGLWKKDDGSKNCDNYYAFGLTFNSYQRENSTENRYLYNQGTGEKKFNTERIFDLGLNIDLTKYRAYDPAIGRWWQVDPLADEADFTSLTPYNYSFNNPVRYNDPYGDCPLCIPFIIAVVETVVAFAEGAAVAAGGTAVAVGVTGIVKNTPPEAAGLGNPEILLNPAAGFRDARLKAEAKERSASDQKLIDQANQKKAKEDAAKSRTQSRQQQTQQGKEKEGKSNQETKGSHDSGNKSKAGKGDHENANARRAREQAKADQKKEESKKKD